MTYERYFSRQLALEGIGREGQDRLGRSSVLIAGLGGTGCGVLMNLALAGVGRITIVDRDVVSIENLHRQPVYAQSDVGRSKSEVAARFVSDRAPGVRVDYRAESLDHDNCDDLLRGSDLAVDCLDNLDGRLALNSACVKGSVPLVHTGAIGWEVSEGLFWSPRTACLECLFPSHGIEEEVPSCETVGILGAVASLASSLGSIEAIRLLAGAEPSPVGRLTVWDARIGVSRTVGVQRRADCGACSGARVSAESKNGRGVAVQLCGGQEYYIARASSKPFARIASELGDRATMRGESVLTVRVGDAEASIFRNGGLLVKGVSSPPAAMSVMRSLGL